MNVSNPWETIDDSIKDAMRERYEAGYEQGKADIKAEAIPVDWIKKKIQWLREHNCAFYNPAYFLETMLAEWKEEQNGRRFDFKRRRT